MGVHGFYRIGMDFDGIDMEKNDFVGVQLVLRVCRNC